MFFSILISAIFKAMLLENPTETGFLHMCISLSILNLNEPLFEKMCKRSGYFMLSSQTVLPDVVTILDAKSNKSR